MTVGPRGARWIVALLALFLALVAPARPASATVHTGSLSGGYFEMGVFVLDVFDPSRPDPCGLGTSGSVNIDFVGPFSGNYLTTLQSVAIAPFFFPSGGGGNPWTRIDVSVYGSGSQTGLFRPGPSVTVQDFGLEFRVRQVALPGHCASGGTTICHEYVDYSMTGTFAGSFNPPSGTITFNGSGNVLASSPMPCNFPTYDLQGLEIQF